MSASEDDFSEEDEDYVPEGFCLELYCAFTFCSKLVIVILLTANHSYFSISHGCMQDNNIHPLDS